MAAEIPPRPVPLIVNFDQIPGELRYLNQWVLWRYVWKEGKDGKPGKWDKPPFQPNGKLASSTAKFTWSSFQAVKEAYECGLSLSVDDPLHFDGVGFVPAKVSQVEHNLQFGDLDKCRDKDTGALSPEAKADLDLVNSYAEVSPSGTGIRSIAKGNPPYPTGKDGCKNGPIELYQARHYLTTTGHRLEEYPDSIKTRPDELNTFFAKHFSEPEPEQSKEEGPHCDAKLTDDQIICLASEAKNSAKFMALMNGDINGYPSHSEADQALCNLLAFYTTSEAQIDSIFRRSGLYREKWDREDYREATITKALSGNKEHYTGTGPKREIAKKILDCIDTEELTEGGNADRLVRICGDVMRYNHTHKKWLIWDGGRWKTDNNGGAMRLAESVVQSLYHAASEADGKDARDSITEHARATDSRKGLSNMLALAANRLKFALTADDFDRDAWLLGAGDVTIDLKTGSKREPQREDLITKSIGVRYDRAAQCPRWLKFMVRTFPDEELRKYIKRAVGYCLTGSMGEQLFFFCYGMGANGKSVFLAVLRALLGEYARMADFSTFLVQRNDKVRNDLAALAGARVITAIESEEGGRLSMQVIKSWTGGDPITARFLFGEFFTFFPVGKLWLAANNKPAITERNLAAWRRVRLIPFTATIPEAERVGEYEKVLYPELPGILNWALEGLQEYLQDGMQTPKAVLDATAEYRKENDSLEQFVSECCETGKLKACKNTDLFNQYLNFCGMSGLKTLSQTKFSIELKTREGISSTRAPAGMTWLGIALKTDWCRVGANPTSITGGSNDVGFEENAQPTSNPPIRGDFAQNGIDPTPDNDSNPTSLHKEGFSVDNEGGIGPHPRREEPTPTTSQTAHPAASSGACSRRLMSFEVEQIHLLICFLLFWCPLVLNVVSYCISHNTIANGSNISTIAPKFATPKLLLNFREPLEKLSRSYAFYYLHHL